MSVTTLKILLALATIAVLTTASTDAARAGIEVGDLPPVDPTNADLPVSTPTISLAVGFVNGQARLKIDGKYFSGGKVRIEANETATAQPANIFAVNGLTAGPLFSKLTILKPCGANSAVTGAFDVTAIDLATGRVSNTIHVESCE